MAADIQIRRWTGPFGSETKTNVTAVNTRLSASDEAVPSSLNYVLIPSSGSNYSYWATYRLFANTAPTGTIDNIRWFTDGTNGWSPFTALAQDATAYVQATGTLGDTGDILNTTNHTGLTAAPVDPFTFVSGTPKSVSGSTSTTGDFGNFMVLQAGVTSGVAPGVTSQESFTWKYDET